MIQFLQVLFFSQCFLSTFISISISCDYGSETLFQTNFYILICLACDSGSNRDRSRSGSGCGCQVVPEELPHSISLLLTGTEGGINALNIAKQKYVQ
jgi:hypothetical protein